MPAQQLYPDFEDAFATSNKDWNGPYWLENAIVQDDLLAATSPDVVAGGQQPVPEAQAIQPKAPPTAVTGIGPIICPTIDSIPRNRQASKVLQCGICLSDKLFDRKYELERHMLTHEDGKHACTVAGCNRKGDKALKRAEHLRNHLGKVHGQ